MNRVIEYLEGFLKGLADVALLEEDPKAGPDPSVTALLLGSLMLWKRHGFCAAAATFFLGYSAFANVSNLAASVRYLKRTPPPLPPRPQ